mgnify:CR=1 FL=1
MKESVIWARYTWCLFHVLAEKIKDEYIHTEIVKLQEIILMIVSILPCPECREHGKRYLQQEIKHNRFGNINDKNTLKLFLYNFHNVVNSKTRKHKVNMDVLKQYANINLLFVIDQWNKYFKLFTIDQYTIREESDRKKKKLFILNYLKNNIEKYI